MSGEAPMAFSEVEAASDLQAWVDCYWQFRVEADSEQVEHWVPPDGGMTLVCHPRSGFLGVSGPFLAPFRPPVAPGDLFLGVRFWPGAGQALLQVAGDATRDQALPLDQVVERSRSEALRAELDGFSAKDPDLRAWDACLRTLVETSRPLDATVMRAVSRILRSQGKEALGVLPESLGLSPRQLRRRFRAACGLTAKELCRIRRFRASALAASRASGEAWVAIAADHGYADQAHLVHEFRRLLGLSPKAFEEQFSRIRHRFLVQ